MYTKNAKVKVLRKESYWYQDIGTIFKVEKSDIRYPIAVRFTKESYNGVSSNNFNQSELMLMN
uniref:Photosystem I subunit IV n=1 Tax=Lithothamnion sp. TaxID=1940749 RepID=A0A3G3MG62_9FLOR|nr:photosystem I subunit IV [Lithothamnion sp.]